MGTWVRPAAIAAGTLVVAGVTFFGVVYLMICEFTKAVD